MHARELSLLERPEVESGNPLFCRALCPLRVIRDGVEPSSKSGYVRYAAESEPSRSHGIFWVLRSRAPWRDLPETYGPRTLARQRDLSSGHRARDQDDGTSL